MLGKVVEYVIVNVSVIGFGFILFIIGAVMGLWWFEKKRAWGVVSQVYQTYVGVRRDLKNNRRKNKIHT